MYKSTSMKRTAGIVAWACGSLFTVFCVLYLYVMQSDLLTATQHLLSKGQTVYFPLWGTVIITSVSVVLPYLYRKIIIFPLRFHALYYFPSCLLLGLLTAMVPAGGWSVSLTVGGGALLVWTFLYLFVAWAVMHYPDRQSEKYSLPVYLWPNFILLGVFMVMTGQVGNTNDVCHYRLKMEREITEGLDSCVLETGRLSLHADRGMTAMRVFALSRTGRLGEKLFDYPQYYGSDGLIPDRADSIHACDWTSDLFRHLGGKPGKGAERATRFLELLSEMPSATPAVNDYLLCAYLLDKNLDAFVSVLPRFYVINESLPHYYKEALVLYDRLHTMPVIVYKDEAVETNLNDFLHFAAQFKDKTERSNQCRRMYGNTYWWYYYFQK